MKCRFSIYVCKINSLRRLSIECPRQKVSALDISTRALYLKYSYPYQVDTVDSFIAASLLRGHS